MITTEAPSRANASAVAVVTPQRGSPQEEIVLPGTIQPFTDAGIFARTNGYVRRWYADIGARVKVGDTLLIIEAMKTLNQIPAPRAGTVTQILFEDGQPVEFGEPLMIIE